MEEFKHIISLVRKIEDGTASPTEVNEIAAYVSRRMSREHLRELDAFYDERMQTPYPEKLREPQHWRKIISQILDADRPLEKVNVAPAHHSVLRHRWVWVAAACASLLLGLVAYFYVHTMPERNMSVVNTQTSDVVAPQSNRAMITLADKSRVYLDSANNGQLATQGNIKLIKLANGKIAYRTTFGEKRNELQYNTLTNPRGSQVIYMQLSDGTDVWLNAGSSITYPVSFVGGRRMVQLEGEGYFQVVQIPSKPFVVTSGNQEVSVLGTHFNIKDYTDDEPSRTTLLEGAVLVRSGNEMQRLEPGLQAETIAGKLSVHKVDTEQAIAWKEGIFNMNNLSFKEFMNQLSRWYDVDIEYAGGKIPDFRIRGEMGRNLSLSQVLEGLKGMNVKFDINGKTLKVYP